MIRELHSKLKSLDLDYLKEEAVWQCRDELLNLNRAQMHEGETIKGDLISPLYRSRSYAEFKSMLATYEAPNFVPDLYLTGDFYKSLQLEVSGGQYEIYSDDEKARDLMLKYKDVVGLSEDSIKKAREIVTAKLMQLIKQKLS